MGTPAAWPRQGPCRTRRAAAELLMNVSGRKLLTLNYQRVRVRTYLASDDSARSGVLREISGRGRS